ncbi:MAG: tetratricopeptide repeat protein [Patescibacteria group bacterium]|nr:tetratricopeptide repeat protein [Patescibacteria group bacterium]
MSAIEDRYDEAIALKEAGNLEEAVAQLESLVQDAPDYALAHAGLSVFYSKQEQHEQAVLHAQKVCELDPDDPFSYMSMSLVCQKAGRLAEAEQALAQAMEKQWVSRRKPATDGQ